MKIRSVSYPWDWIRDTSVDDITSILKKRREFDVADWDCFKNMEHKMPHDYKDDSHNASELKFEGGDVLEKYKRRFKRMFDHLEDDIPTYLLRFGDGNGLDKLQEILPSSCKIIHIENGHPDSQATYLQIMSIVGEEIISDPFYLIINSILDIQKDIQEHKLIYPIKFEDIIKYTSEKDKLCEIFNDTSLVFTSVDSLFNYTYKRILSITGIEYALL
jgi:hypothetical protein